MVGGWVGVRDRITERVKRQMGTFVLHWGRDGMLCVVIPHPSTAHPPLQDDLLYATLTVHETLLFAAMLRLPKHKTKAEKVRQGW